MIKKFKIELSVLLILILNIFISYNLDIGFYNFFKSFDNSIQQIYLKKFFILITSLGDSKWYFYNFQFDQNNPSTHPHYFEHVHYEQSEWQQDIHPLGWKSEWPGYGGTNKLDYYKYTKTNLDDSYCYMIKVEDDKNNFRNSHIKGSDNYTRNANLEFNFYRIEDSSSFTQKISLKPNCEKRISINDFKL